MKIRTQFDTVLYNPDVIGIIFDGEQCVIEAIFKGKKKSFPIVKGKDLERITYLYDFIFQADSHDFSKE